MKQKSPHRLSVERLEDRLTPTTGVPWYDAGRITLSFVPDGADAGSGTTTSLASLLGASSSTTWQREILRAYQSWATVTNVNIGLIPDSGSPLGITGFPQKDPRFGDIRVSARPLGAGTGGTLAQAMGFDYAGGTWSGDMVLNSNQSLAVGGVGGAYDLFSIALHEAGHSLSLLDNATEESAAMWSVYSVRTGLAPSDVAAVQALYGARTADPYETSGGNGTTATAFNLTQNGNLSAISADITQAGDVDVYRFTTPSIVTGISGLKVNLDAARISLLTARLSVLDAAGNTVASTVTTDPLSNNVSITLPNYQSSTTYYVRVEGAGSDVFSVGAYNLRLNYAPWGYGNSAVAGSQFVNMELLLNDTRATAATLGIINAGHSTTFAVVGSMSTATDSDWYRITPTTVASFTGTLTVGLVPLSSNGFRPLVSVYDAQGTLLPSVVVTNENGAFTVQLGAQETGTTYYLRVSAANPSGTHAVGAYTLAANLSRAAVTAFDTLGPQALTAAQPTVYSEMTVDSTRLTQFSLSASTAAGSARTAVRMTVFDGNGQVVLTLAVEAGKPLVTGTVWLMAGTYTVAVTAATQDGSSLPAASYSLGKREKTDPIDPYLIDPIGTSPPPPPTSPPPPPPPVVVILDPVPTPPPGGVVGQLVNPFLGLL